MQENLSLCGCKVMSVNVHLYCFFMCFLVPDLYWDDCVELCGDKRGSHWANCGFHVVMDFPVQHLCVARYALFTHYSPLNCRGVFW